uniref:DUF4524 domain-containing protein n=1 Tax=Macrostomum lignano TaxID=282301 RepID=A0A1I8GJ98_9PLAT
SFQASSLIKIGEKDTSKVPESEPIPVLFVVYSNDAVLVEYSDESTLQLSPCGTVFQFELPPHEVSLLDTSGSRTIQQKSEFATSRFHGKVAEALHLRNMFAWQPCLLPSLMRHGVEWASNYDDELFDSSHFYWPSDPSDWQLGRSTRFSSIDGRAFLTVPVGLALGQPFDGATTPEKFGRLVQINHIGHWPDLGVRGQSGSRWAVATPRTQPVPRRCRQPHLHEFGFGASSAPTPPSGLQWLSAAAPELKSIRIVCRDGVVYR